MDTLAQLVGSLAWPLTALFLGLMILRELKNGLLAKLMPYGGSVKGPGFELQANAAFQRQTTAAKQAATKANVAVVEQERADPEKDLTPYDQVIDAWRELATVFTAKAVHHGGVDDKRKIYLNIENLRTKAIFDEAVLDSVSDLFQARNSVRKLGADSIAEVDAETFVQTATALTKVFQ